MRTLIEHAEYELDLAGLGDPDADYDGAIKGVVLDVVRAFSAYGHSGGSAALTADLLEKLLRGKPLTPLTGEPDEWDDVSAIGDGSIAAQNRRCSRVVRYRDGRAVDVEGAVRVAPDGERRTAPWPVTFPYSPTAVTVHVAEGQL